MADAPYTQLRHAQWRGPSTSDDYNARIEENYKDLVILYNRIRMINVELAEFYRRVIKDQYGITRLLNELEARVETLEAASTQMTFRTIDQVDTDRFNPTPYAISPVNQLTFDTRYGIVVLPRVDTSSLSKLYFTNSLGEEMLPPTLETRVVPLQTTADSSSATIDSSDPMLAVVRKPGRVWERNVITNTANPNGAVLTFYLKVPTDLYTTDKSNVVVLQPFPAFSTDILEVSYTSNVDLVMQDTDGYTPLNDQGLHAGDAGAVGWLPPGGFPNDSIINAGPREYYFDPRVVTGLRIRLQTTHYAMEASQYVYSYGLTQLDLRYDKFMSTGKAMLKFTPATGTTISSVDDVVPDIWNVPNYAMDDVFSWRAIWETSPGSGTYSTTPVPNSPQVWIEVTLNQTENSGTPAMSGLTVSYS
jgi:hypothetical protein